MKRRLRNCASAALIAKFCGRTGGRAGRDGG
jgi:hypothetical protein